MARLLLSLLLLSCLALLLLGQVNASPSAAVDWEAYEGGKLGLYPQTDYQTLSFSAPLIHVKKWDSRCDMTSLTFLTPRGNEIPRNKAFVYDHQGSLVWALQEHGSINNLQVQRYKGNDFLTYWVGNDMSNLGHGHGYYKMLDQTYTLVHTIAALGDVHGDYHEFSITRDDTALLTAYVKTPWDLSRFGRSEGFIWDCVFQEIDFENDKILFEWRASQHYVLNHSGRFTGREGTNEDPWDWFHINSVEKDTAGNYLVSAAHISSVVYIDGKTGKPIWHLGGSKNSFVDLSQGNATRLWGPRMAHWTDSGSAIRLLHAVASFSTSQDFELQVMKVNIDTQKWVAKINSQFNHPDRLPADAQGSIQTLPNGNHFLGYGFSPVYSEFSASGTLLCDTHFSPVNIVNGGEPKPGVVQSYRTYKHRWVGIPTERPTVKLDNSSIYVSWNGATGVEAWKLAGRSSSFQSSSIPWETIGTYPKSGFETNITMTGDYFASYQLTALDSLGNRIRSWDIHPGGDTWELLYDNESRLFEKLHSHSTGQTALLICAILLLVINRRHLPDLAFLSRWCQRGLRPPYKGNSGMPGTEHQRSPLPVSSNPFETSFERS